MGLGWCLGLRVVVIGSLDEFSWVITCFSSALSGTALFNSKVRFMETYNRESVICRLYIRWRIVLRKDTENFEAFVEWSKARQQAWMDGRI